MQLSQDMVQRRLETVASGTYKPEISGIPGIVFVKMGLKEKGISSRAFSAKLKELFAEGGYFSEALLPSTLEKVCKDNSIDVDAPRKLRKRQLEFWNGVPEELKHPIDSLTQEEVLELSPEAKAERGQIIEEREKQFREFMEGFYTAEDYKLMEVVKQIENLELEIRNNTAEHHARKYQMEHEILSCARREDTITEDNDRGEPYFTSIEEIQSLEETNREGLIQLYLKWKQFKGGLTPDYFRPDSLN